MTVRAPRSNKMTKIFNKICKHCISLNSISPPRRVIVSTLVEPDWYDCLAYAKIWRHRPNKQGQTAIEFCQQDIHCLLKLPWRILQSKVDVSKTEKTMMRCEGRFSSIFFVNSNLPISRSSVQCQKYWCVPQRIDEFVCEWYWLWISNRHCIKIMVVNAEVRSSVFLRDIDNGWGQLGLGGFDNVHCYHLIYFQLLALSRLWLGALLACVNWSLICVL